MLNAKNVYAIPMIIGINASFARKPGTGIGQVTLNFLHELICQAGNEDIKTGDRFILYTEESLPEGIVLPGNFSSRTMLPPWKRDDLIRKLWWETRTLPNMAKADGCEVLLSLYQCPTMVLHGTKHVMVVHDIIPHLFPKYISNARKKLYQLLTERAVVHADRIVAVSVRTEKDLVQHLHIDSSRVSVGYVDVDPIFKQDVSSEKKHAVMERYGLKPGYIYNGGGLEVRKNADGVLRAYKLLVEMYRKDDRLGQVPRLVISGKLMPELAPLIVDIERLVSELDLVPYVDVLGYVPQEDLPALYKNASLFVFPSHYEGFGLPVLEAMNSAVPVIAARHSSLPEVGGDGVLYCHAENVEEIARTMKKVLTQQSLRETLSRRGYERAKRFSWEIFTKKVLGILIQR